MPTAYRKGTAAASKTPAAGSAAQLKQQSAAGHALYEKQMGTVDQLQLALSNGDINQAQYDDAIGQMFDAQLAQLQRQLGAQGKPEAAATVPVGIGASDQPAPAGSNAASPFAPPEGVTFTQPSGRPKGALSEDQSLLAGPTSRPNEPVTAPAPRQGIVPDAVLQSIPALVRASQDPDAAPAVRALMRLLDHYLSGGQSAR